MVYHARLLPNRPTTVKNDRVRDTTHVETGGQIRVAVRIHFSRRSLVRPYPQPPAQLQEPSFGRGPPRRPEIDRHWNASFLNNLVEQLSLGFDRSGSRTYWRSSAGTSAIPMDSLRK